MENLKLPAFLERDMKQLVAQPINDIDRFVERIYLSAPNTGFTTLKKRFSTEPSQKIPKNKNPLIYGIDNRHKGTYRHNGKNYKITVYESVDSRRDPFIYIAKPSFDLLEALALENNYRVELVKFSMDIKCKNLLSTRLVYDVIREFGYFPNCYADTKFNETYKELTDLPKRVGSTFRIKRKNESLLNAPRVVVRESSQALKRPEKGFSNKDIDRVRISIWKYAEGKGKNIHLKEFIENEKEFNSLNNGFRLKDIPSKKEKMSFYNKFVDPTIDSPASLKPREAPDDISFITEKIKMKKD